MTKNIQITSHSHPEFHTMFPEVLKELLMELHLKFNPRRLELLQQRDERQIRYDQGEVPRYLAENEKNFSSADWKVATVPEVLKCRRVEITGPVSSAKMVINMLSRNDQGARADMCMMDFEDSMMPNWNNVIQGISNAKHAVMGDLQLTTPQKNYSINPDDMAYPMIRVRGLHLNESNVVINNQKISASIFDFASTYFHCANYYLKRGWTPKYYIPKCEHHLEARWWNELFVAVQKAMGHAISTLRATFLIETLPATFQLEEILFEIKDHAAGFNVGRWDKIFSDIKILKNHQDRILADRATINMLRPWMENYAKRVIKVCHSHGAFAMGGMSAFTPGKTEEERKVQTTKVVDDKSREYQWGHDGCWVSHPYFIAPALSAFPENNQLTKTLENFPLYPEILPQGGGPYTKAGLATNVRVAIAYQQGWNEGLGCIAWDNLMEDLATLEISRAQVWQWRKHGITLDIGEKVTTSLLNTVFDEELQKILKEVPMSEHPKFKQAKIDAQKIFLQEYLPNFLTLDSI
jgi:malate synthase